jgi:hypothetical protein
MVERTRRRFLVVLGFAVAAVGVAAEARGTPASTVEAEVFHLRWSVPEQPASDVSGIDLRWILSASRWSLKAALPALRTTGPAGLYLFGPSYGGVRARSGSGGEPAGNGSAGGGDGVGRAPLATSTGDPDREEAGIGDLRLQAALRLGKDTGAGRFFARAGAKAPIADETPGIGTGEWDGWAGFGWRREGWTTDVEASLEWVHLGEPEGYDMDDGAAMSVQLEWPLGRGGLRAGVEAIEAGPSGDTTRVRAIAGGYRTVRARASWLVEVAAGLTETAPDFGFALAFRY